MNDALKLACMTSILLLSCLTAELGYGRSTTITVQPGTSIQAAVDLAKPGDVIILEAGEYEETIHIDKDNITLRGKINGDQWPHLNGKNRLNDAVLVSGSDFLVEDIKITNYKGNGIMTQGSHRVTMRRVLAGDIGIYGLYTTLGRDILIEDSVTWGIADAGIYVGMCENVDVRRNEAFENVAGIEIENSVNVLVEGNVTYNNTGGILVFALPGLVTKRAENVILRGNFIYDNNHRNFGAPGSPVAGVPPGSGLLNLAADRTLVYNNLFRNNSTAAIIFADHRSLPGTKLDPETEPNPDNNAILQNLYMDNGRKTLGNYLTWYHFIARNFFAHGATDTPAEDLFPPSVELYSTGPGEGNCVQSFVGKRTLGLDKFVQCEPGAYDELKALTTMIGYGDGSSLVDYANVGEKTYLTVCAGCHAHVNRIIGPPVTEIQEKYANDAAGIAAFAKNPTRVRSGFPEMPSQAYLGDEKLQAAAEYLLQIVVREEATDANEGD